MNNFKHEECKKYHLCEGLNNFNSVVKDNRGYTDNTQIRIVKEDNKWIIEIPYLNNEDDCFEFPDAQIKFCPFCGKELE